MGLYEIVLIVSSIIVTVMWIMLLYRIRAYTVMVFLLMVLSVTEVFILLEGYEFKWHLITIISVSLTALVYALIQIRLSLREVYTRLDAQDKEAAVREQSNASKEVLSEVSDGTKHHLL